MAIDRIERPLPAAIAHAAAAYDAKRHAMLVFGGSDPQHKDQPPLLRRLDLETFEWSVIETTGPGPRAATLPGLVYDPKRDRAYVFGGWERGADRPSGELWFIELAGEGARVWQRLPDGPPGRNGCVLVVDPPRDRLVLFAGDAGPDPKYGFTPLNDLWAFDLVAGTWGRLTAGGDIPSPRWNLAAAVDEQRSRMFIFGGAGHDRGQPVMDNFIYELDLSSLRWTRHPAREPAPTPVEGTSLTYDPGKDLLVVVGGLPLSDAGDRGTRSVWLYDLKARSWIEQPRALPGVRQEHVAIYDPRKADHIVVGGETVKEGGNFYARGQVLLDVLRLSVRCE